MERKRRFVGVVWQHKNRRSVTTKEQEKCNSKGAGEV